MVDKVDRLIGCFRSFAASIDDDDIDSHIDVAAVSI